MNPEEGEYVEKVKVLVILDRKDLNCIVKVVCTVRQLTQT